MQQSSTGKRTVSTKNNDLNNKYHNRQMASRFQHCGWKILVLMSFNWLREKSKAICQTVISSHMPVNENNNLESENSNSN